MRWRWDQGRMDYFRLEEVCVIAKALRAFNGQALPRGNDPDTLRAVLETYSERPFAPDDYTVWRNYKRVFGVLGLATEVDHLLVATDVCKQLASGALGSDDYLIHVAKSFYYPSPVFEDYTPGGNQIFPMCAILRALVARFVTRGIPSISLDEIVDLVKGNNAVGNESLAYFSALPATGTRIRHEDAEFRQIREMVRFMSQLSFLKWENPDLILDIDDPSIASSLADVFEPIVRPRKANPAEELIAIGANAHEQALPEIVENSGLSPFDLEFTEGSRVKSSHLRMERSGKLRELYFAHHPDPHLCDMCEMDTLARYPWVDKVVELHHLLPLAAPVRLEKNTTSLKDMVGLCPTCHRSTHKYYSQWLRGNGQRDFSDISQARDVYSLAKTSIVI